MSAWLSEVLTTSERLLLVLLLLKAFGLCNVDVWDASILTPSVVAVPEAGETCRPQSLIHTTGT
jgi:hypothetical protein